MAQEIEDLLLTLEKHAAVQEYMARLPIHTGPCCCMGPQNGEPRCPCAMNYVVRMPSGYYEMSEVPDPDNSCIRVVANPL